jgi:hypothetical protein
MQQANELTSPRGHKTPKPVHATVMPRVMKRVNVGTFRVKGGLPQFEVSCDQADKDNLAYHPVELVDIKNMAYELVYNCQNFGDEPIEITVTWIGGQEPHSAQWPSRSNGEILGAKNI